MQRTPILAQGLSSHAVITSAGFLLDQPVKCPIANHFGSLAPPQSFFSRNLPEFQKTDASWQNRNTCALMLVDPMVQLMGNGGLGSLLASLI